MDLHPFPGTSDAYSSAVSRLSSPLSSFSSSLLIEDDSSQRNMLGDQQLQLAGRV